MKHGHRHGTRIRNDTDIVTWQNLKAEHVDASIGEKCWDPLEA